MIVSKTDIKAEKLRNTEVAILSICNLLCQLPKANFYCNVKVLYLMLLNELNAY